jgi:hypothetical protein
MLGCPCQLIAAAWEVVPWCPIVSKAGCLHLWIFPWLHLQEAFLQLRSQVFVTGSECRALLVEPATAKNLEDWAGPVDGRDLSVSNIHIEQIVLVDRD